MIDVHEGGTSEILSRQVVNCTDSIFTQAINNIVCWCLFGHKRLQNTYIIRLTSRGIEINNHSLVMSVQGASVIPIMTLTLKIHSSWLIGNNDDISMAAGDQTAQILGNESLHIGSCTHDGRFWNSTIHPDSIVMGARALTETYLFYIWAWIDQFSLLLEWERGAL